MVLIETCNSSAAQQQWFDAIAEWHQFCLDQGLNPWEHLITKDLSFYVSQELYDSHRAPLKVG